MSDSPTLSSIGCEKFQIAPVRDAAALAAYRRLRHDVFVTEQGLFAGTDSDDHDEDPEFDAGLTPEIGS